ncbi:ABC transporter substrate-binding protein [Nitratireductor sp. StC3]|uniref:ABC transporter substrate-binding protein n=1 Tax=Nitratireductor sp. StC3 TaxID=2126741 RepID=UPI000D0DF69E|nr:ABC transporter substrate-binding protein [Nitratireductor sp. StC3]PSM16250.1 ABC transporter substrate-binding protein [Nitratireductor sp. StC3]
MFNITRRSLLIGASLSALAFGTLPALAVNDTVRIGMDVDSVSLDPRTARNTTDYRVLDLVYDGLVRMNSELVPQPNLATKWEQVDPTTLVVTLREGVTFHDGTPLTAADVVFTYTTILDPKLASNAASLFAPIDSVEATAPNQVTFKLKHPYAPLLSYLDVGITPKHAVEAGHDLSGNPIGTGPYKFVRWNRGSEIVLEANPNYRDGAPGTGEIAFVTLGDNTARAQALEAGDLDMIMTPLSPDDVERLADDERFTHTKLPGLTITYLNFNTASPVLSDPQLRHALGMLVDQEVIVEQIYGGLDIPGTSVLLPTSAWSYTDTIRQPSFDMEAAAKALADLGWTKGGDGILQKDGTKLSITLSTNSEDSARIQTIEYIQNVMQQVGVDAKIEIADFPAWIANVRSGKYDIALLSWVNLVDPDRGTYSQLTSDGALNWGKYSNLQVDAALELGRSATDQQTRVEAYREAASIIAEEVPYYIISYTGFDAFAQETVEGGRPDDARGYVRGLMAQ